MARKLKVKSSKYIKTMLKTESYTENKPKYTKYIQNSGPESKRRHLFNREVKRRRLIVERRYPFNRAMGFLRLLKMQETCK